MTSFGTLKADTLTHSTAGSLATNFVVNGSAKAWAQQDGAAATARDSFNVASITDEGTGDASYTLTNAMSDSNSSVTALTGYKAATSIEIAHLRELTASKVRIRNSNSSSYRDPDTYCSTVHGDLA
jgi:hypothetical protein